jgi:hypothetical protein
MSMTLAKAIKEGGGLVLTKDHDFWGCRPTQTILYAQGVVKKGKSPNSDEIVDFLSTNYPEFEIHTEDDLCDAIENREVWTDEEGSITDKFEEFFGRFEMPNVFE